jgi:hypothetical protein
LHFSYGHGPRRYLKIGGWRSACGTSREVTPAQGRLRERLKKRHSPFRCNRGWVAHAHAWRSTRPTEFSDTHGEKVVQGMYVYQCVTTCRVPISHTRLLKSNTKMSYLRGREMTFFVCRACVADVCLVRVFSGG